MVIGVSGVAGVGKDLFVDTCMNELSKRCKTTKKFAIAKALKEEVRGWCLEHYNIDSVNCSREAKEKIRSFLVAHGTTKRHATQGRHWVEQLDSPIKQCENNYDYLFVSDVRYSDYPKDEAYWIKEELDGVLVHISQWNTSSEGVTGYKNPANSEEARNEPSLKKQADYNLVWEYKDDLINKDKYISSKVVQFIEWLSTQ